MPASPLAGPVIPPSVQRVVLEVLQDTWRLNVGRAVAEVIPDEQVDGTEHTKLVADGHDVKELRCTEHVVFIDCHRVVSLKG